MASISPDEASVLAKIDAKASLMRAQVEKWASINSGSRNLAGLAHMAAELQEAFAGLGSDMRVVDPAPVNTIDAAGRSVALAHGRNIHLIKRAQADYRIVLTGHYDTVFAADHGFQALRWLDANTLNGPGVADMKGGIAVMLAALDAFEASPFADAVGWEVILNADEEVSSLGSAPLIAEVGARCRIGLTFEPSYMPDGTLAGARKGSGNFSARIAGRAAHAGRNPEDGRNAVVAACDLGLRIAAFPQRNTAVSANVARIDGGGPNNVVPDLAVLRFNLRPATSDDQAWAQAALDAAIADVAAAHGVDISCHGHFARPPKPMDPRSEQLFGLVRDCGHALGLDLSWRASGGVCDGNNLAACGVAVVDTLGVRGGDIHSDREYMFVDSLAERAKLACLLLMRIAQGARI